MDSGSIIAIVTVSITAFAALVNKSLDIQQKTVEHKLSIRSIYVTKKIQAGESFVGRNILRINRSYASLQYLRHLQDSKEVKMELLDKLENTQKAIRSNLILDNNFTETYFQLDTLNEIASSLVDLSNESTKIINSYTSKDHFKFDDKLEAEIAKAIETDKKLLNVYKSMNKVIYNELRNYDIIDNETY